MEVLVLVIIIVLFAAFGTMWALGEVKKRNADEQALFHLGQQPRIGDLVCSGWAMLGLTWLFEAVFVSDSSFHFLSFGWQPPRGFFIASSILGFVTMLFLSAAYAVWHLRRMLSAQSKSAGLVKLHFILGGTALIFLVIAVSSFPLAWQKWFEIAPTP